MYTEKRTTVERRTPLARPHEVIQVLKLLKTLDRRPKNTLAMYRELRNEVGFRNHCGFYRQLRLCLKYGLIELSNMDKKWGIPTKTYCLTEKGKDFLRLFNEKIWFN